MRTRRIGTLEVSLIGLGCNNFGGRIDYDRSADVVSAALDNGITFFDTADIYGATKSEEFLGQALGRRRDDVVVATKFGMKIDDDRQGAKPDYVRRALEDSLRRLGTDRIDLYILHAPDADHSDRRHPGGARRLRRGGQGTRDRLLEFLGWRSCARRRRRRAAVPPASCASRTSTASSNVNPSVRCSPNAGGKPSLSSPISPSHRDSSPVSTRRARHLPPVVACRACPPSTSPP